MNFLPLNFGVSLLFDNILSCLNRIPGTKVPVYEGQAVLFPVWSIHRDPKNWTDPDQFLPERFLNGGNYGNDDLSFLAFGAGPRNCIGKKHICLGLSFLNGIITFFNEHVYFSKM